MTSFNSQNSWNVGHVAGTCASCGVELPPNTSCWAALCDHPVAAKTASPSPPLPPTSSSSSKSAKAPEVEPTPFARVDFCEACWSLGKRPATPLEMFSFWKTVVPLPQQKKKLLVDDSVLLDVFSRMEGRTEPQEVRFRFVLALILMRKRLLKYESMEASQQDAPAPTLHESHPPVPEIWRMIPRGTETVVHVINPHLTAEQIAEVSQQLSAILAEEV